MHRPAFQVVNFPFPATWMGGTRFSPTLDFIEWVGDGLGWAQHPVCWNVSGLLGWAELNFALCLDGNQMSGLPRWVDGTESMRTSTTYDNGP